MKEVRARDRCEKMSGESRSGNEGLRMRNGMWGENRDREGKMMYGNAMTRQRGGK